MLKTPSLAAVASIALCAASLAADVPDQPSSAEQAIERGLNYLAGQQGDDGGWHSKNYGQLKGGPGVTALVLYAYSRCPEHLRRAHPNLAARGFDFFKPGLEKRSTLAASDGSLDYPTYASALWLSARSHLSQPAAASEQRKVVDYLLAAQLLDARGFEPDHPAYGGWDFLGPNDAHGITTGSNVSLAAYILEALADPGRNSNETNAAREHAIAWLKRTQQPDGGFAFTPEPASLNNKAMYEDEERTHPRSYGTATSDGVRALIAAGLKPDDNRVQIAVKWLVERPALEVVPGFEDLPAEAGWQRGLRFYYYAALADAMRHFPPNERDARQRSITKILLREQRADGCWMNESARMREDDPLIATSFALSALGTMLNQQERPQQ